MPTRRYTRSQCLLFICLLGWACGLLRAQEVPVPGRWSVEKAWAWYDRQPWLIGCNYIPATAINQLEMWQAETFDPETIDKELGWAEALGFNSLRVYLHDLVWGQGPDGLYQRMDRFLDLCDRHGMKVLFVFFDDCHRPDPKVGRQPLPVIGFHNSGWAKSPATELLVRYHAKQATEAEVGRLRGYVQGTLSRFKTDTRVLAWELYNEPGRSAQLQSVTLLRDAWRWAREVAPSQPICSTAEGSAGAIYIDIARANSDVISFHNYNAADLEQRIKTYLGLGRPTLCTEYMARPGSTFENSLPLLKQNRIAAFNWGLVSGKTGTVWPWSSRRGKDVYALRRDGHVVRPGQPFPEPQLWFHDIYRVDGTPFVQDEIDFIRQMTGVTTGPGKGRPQAWIRFDAPGAEVYRDVPYHWLNNGALYLEIDVPPAEGHVLDLLWGAKDDQRGATVAVNGVDMSVQAGGYDGFKWQRVQMPTVTAEQNYRVVIRAAQPRAAFLAAVRLATAQTPPEATLPQGQAHRIRLTGPPPTALDKWAAALQSETLTLVQRAVIHGRQANEALRRCRKFIDGWLAHADPKTGLIPRNLGDSKHFWNGRDSAADNYAFMVLTTALTDRALYDGRMLDMLHTETRVTSRLGALPADFDFNKQGFRFDEPDLNRLIFDGSEYVKDGLMPITEWLGPTPWSDRMISIVDSLLEQAPVRTPGGNIPSTNVEVNGEMMQVLSRLCFMTGNEAYLDMACRIADYYLLGDRHPTRNVTRLGLRDHNCELISGLTEVYAACHALRPDKVNAYRGPIHAMLDDILAYGVNEHGLMYQVINPQTGAVLDATIHDNWGYNYNGFYTVYLLDGVERYRQATRRAMSNLKDHYWKFQWEGWSSDGIADSVEGAINLLNREPDVPGVPEWIDANINRMLDIQKPDGVIEGWHGDGNYARTAIMWVLWKQQGLTVRPWRPDVILGAVRQGQKVHLVVTADRPWKGTLLFDSARHRRHMKIPLDYPRINQFPEWFTVDSNADYELTDSHGATRIENGNRLIDGLSLELDQTLVMQLVVKKHQDVQ